MVLSWIVALIGLYLMVHWPRQVAVGLFVLPLVLGLVVAAGWFAPRDSNWLEDGMMAFWGTVHGIFLLAGAVFTCVAFAAGLMYLAQMRRLKSKRSNTVRASRCRASSSRERVNRGAITIAFPLLTFGLLIGMVLSLKARSHGRRVGLHAALDRSQGRQRPGDVAGLRGACSTPGSGRRCGAAASWS